MLTQHTTPVRVAVQQMQAEGWRAVVCPLCGGGRHEISLVCRTELFGTSEAANICRCECGMLLTNPQPYGDTLGDYYKSGVYYTHTDKKGVRERLRHRLQTLQLRGVGRAVRSRLEAATGIARFASKFAPGPFTLEHGMSLLDYGCGAGRLVRLASDLGLGAVGIDPDPDARQNAAAKGIRIFESLEDLDARAGREGPYMFDRMVMMHSLEHIPEPAEILRRLRRRLRLNGRILIAVPNAASRQAEFFGDAWIGYDMPRHLWHFTPETLERLVRLSGFRPLHTATLEHRGFEAGSARHAAARGQAVGAYPADEALDTERAGAGAEIVLVAEVDRGFDRAADGGRGLAG